MLLNIDKSVEQCKERSLEWLVNTGPSSQHLLLIPTVFAIAFLFRVVIIRNFAISTDAYNHVKSM